MIDTNILYYIIEEQDRLTKFPFYRSQGLDLVSNF